MLDQLLVKYPNGEGDALLRIENKQRQVQDDSKPVSVDDEQEGQESVNGGFGDDVGVETVAEINGVDVVTVEGKKKRRMSAHELNSSQSFQCSWPRFHIFIPPHDQPPATKPTRTTLDPDKWKGEISYHSKSLYIIVKKTCKNRLTALINTDSR